MAARRVRAETQPVGLTPPLGGGGAGAGAGAGVGFGLGDGAGFWPTPGAYAPLLPLEPLSLVVVGEVYVDEPHEYELELLQELELDAVCSPWYAVSVGRVEGTWKSGQLLPWAASM